MKRELDDSPHGGGSVSESGVETLMTESEIDRVFAEFRRAFGDRDYEALASLWTPGFRVWHSTDCRAKDRDEYLAFIARLPIRKPQFIDVRREYFANGFVQQQSVEIENADGPPHRSIMCLVVKMENGLISRIDEYVAFPQQ